MLTTETPEPRPPTLCWSAYPLCISTCRSPASPRSCHQHSVSWATPVAPIGCPFASRPPDVLIGMLPVSEVSPSSDAMPPLPLSKKPRSSTSRISVMVKQSCTSAQSIWLGSTPAIRYARSLAMVVALRPVKLCFSWRYGWSVATPKPATYTGLSGNSAGRSAFTRIVAAAPSVFGPQSSRCRGWERRAAAQGRDGARGAGFAGGRAGGGRAAGRGGARVPADALLAPERPPLGGDEDGVDLLRLDPVVDVGDCGLERPRRHLLVA